MIYYLSEFAPFTHFHKEHIHKLQQVDPHIILLFLNNTMDEYQIKLYIRKIREEVVDISEFHHVTSAELINYPQELIYVDGLASTLIPSISDTNIMWPQVIHGYERQPFTEHFIFDHISLPLATYIIQNEMFQITRHMSLIFHQLSYGRFQHTMRVVYMIKQLALTWHVDPDIAVFTALFHDYAKEIPADELSVIMQKNFPLYSDAPDATWHGFVGAFMLQQLFGASDVEDDILEAIAFHSLGTANMSTLGLILFIADYCEFGRSHQAQIEKVWSQAQTNLYEAAKMKLEFSNEWLQSKASHATHTYTIYHSTKEMQNWLNKLLEEENNNE